jgi:hypothetical protein
MVLSVRWHLSLVDLVAALVAVPSPKVRRRVGKQSADARKARGELPGFMKHKKGKGE